MGLLRIYLALCVIVGHSGPLAPFEWFDAILAVKVFFVISGFYMELVLTKKYSDSLSFYANRFLRIFVPYWICLAFVAVVCLASRMGTGDALTMRYYFDGLHRNNSTLGFCLGALSNVTLFFQDSIAFLQDKAGNGISIVKTIRGNSHPLSNYLLLPQCWSVGLELLFYLCVPFLHRLKTPVLCIVIGSSLFARILAYEGAGLVHDPWSHRFFLFELAFFVAGMLSCRIYIQMEKRDFIRYVGSKGSGTLKFMIGLLLLVILIALDRCFVSQASAVNHHYAVFGTPVIAAGMMPFLFILTKANVLDRFIGELSYPVYLVHFITVSYLNAKGVDRIFQAEATVMISIAISVILYLTVIKPLDALRHKEVALRIVSRTGNGMRFSTERSQKH
jgi:peptidoglycan/LPS O-acetylase OafA/YrhL